MRWFDNKDRIGALLLLAFSLAYLGQARVLPLDPTATDESFTARTLPIGLAVAAILFASIQLALSLRTGSEARISAAVRGFRWAPTLSLIAAMAVYALVFELLGFLLSSILFLKAGFIILGERRWLVALPVAVGLVLFLWLLLTQAFGVYLDPGDLYRSLAGRGA